VTRSDPCLLLNHNDAHYNTLNITFLHTRKHVRTHPPAHSSLTQLKACRAYRGSKHGGHAESYLADAFSNVKCTRVQLKAGVCAALQELKQHSESKLRPKSSRETNSERKDVNKDRGRFIHACVWVRDRKMPTSLNFHSGKFPLCLCSPETERCAVNASSAPSKHTKSFYF